MKIIVVGAGLAGPSAALALSHSPTNHRVVFVESAPQLAEVGAGVQFTPVATRQFLNWGLEDALLGAAALPSTWNLRRGSDGEGLNCVSMKQLENDHGAPYIVVHRADLHRILHEACVKRGVEIRLNATVKQYGFEDGWMELEGGDRMGGDLVIACDGINSMARGLLVKKYGLKGGDSVEPTGWAACRAMVDVGDVLGDMSTGEIVAEHAGNCWADTNKSVMTYMVRDSGKLNMVLSHPDNVDTASSVTLANAMGLFERVRKPRAEVIRDASLHAGEMLHLSPGADLEVRDRNARNDGVQDEDEKIRNPLLHWKSYGITYKIIRDLCYGYNVLADIEASVKR